MARIYDLAKTLRVIPPDADEAAGVADDDVIDEFDVERAACGNQADGDGEVGWRCAGVAGGVIVHGDA